MLSTGANFRNGSRCSIERCSVSFGVRVDRVPLVDRDDDGAAALEDVAGDVRVLVGDALGRVEQQEDDVGLGDRLQRLDDRELLDRLEHLAAPAQPGGVDQVEVAAAALERNDDRVARRSRLVEGDQALLAEPGVDQRRLADVGPAGDGELDRRVGVGLLARALVVVVGLGRQRLAERGLECRFGERDDALPVRRRDRMRRRRGRARRTRPAAATRACPRPCWRRGRRACPRVRR